MRADASTINPPHTYSVQETLSLIGSSLPATFYYQGNYVDSTFEYWGTQDVMEIKSGADLPLSVGQTCLVYVATQTATASPDYVTVQVQPEYSIFDTQAVHMTACLQSTSAVSSAAYASPSWLWFVSGYGDYIAGNTFADTNGDRRCVRFRQGSADQWATAVAIDYHTNSDFQAYSKRISFYGNTQTNYSDSRYRLYISPLQVSADGSAQSGTFTTATSGGSEGNVTVNVNVDLDETNSLLEDIWEGITDLGGTIWEGITGVFVPSDEAVTAFQDSIQETLEDTFIPLYAAQQVTGDIFESYLTGSAVGTIDLPVARYIQNYNPDTGTRTVGYLWQSRQVQLLPNRNAVALDGEHTLGDFYDIFATIIDIVSTILVLNMLRNKIEAILVGEVVVSHVD